MAAPFPSYRYRLSNQQRGKPIKWWKSVPCECVDPTTGLRDARCTMSPSCERDGRRYTQQEIPLGVDGAPALALVSETRQIITPEGFAALEAGSSTISVFDDLMPMSRLDRVALLDRFETHREVIVRGAVGTPDPLTFFSFANYLHCSQGSREFDSDDFGINGAGRVTWFGNPDEPKPGSRYTIEYLHFPLFYVAHGLTNRGLGSDGLPLPREWVLSAQPPQVLRPA